MGCGDWLVKWHLDQKKETRMQCGVVVVEAVLCILHLSMISVLMLCHSSISMSPLSTLPYFVVSTIVVVLN